MDYSIEIIFEDEHLLAINKPAGLLTIRDGYNPALPFVTSLLQPKYGKLWVVHRLDRDTSGILLLARSAECHRILNSSFETRQVKKTYHALIIGNPPWSETIADMPLKIDGDRRHRTLISLESGKAAKTDLRILTRGDQFSLVEAQPHTGYTHQIRAHLAALGFPILADPLYGSKSNSLKSIPIIAATTMPIARLSLHALSIEFHHPLSSQLMNLVAPYPADFQSAINQLVLRI